MLKKNIISNVLYLYIIAITILFFFLSCSTTSTRLICGNYYSQGEYIIERSNKDGWEEGHYLLTIDSSNNFVLKKVSCMAGTLYSVCSGYLQQQGRATYALNNVKKDYPYGVLGNPYYNENKYRIIIKNNETIILRKGQWNTILKYITQDSIPESFDFTKFGYD